MKRRSFLKAASGVVGSGVLGIAGIDRQPAAAEPLQDDSGGLPKRLLGRTGRRISIIGFPGLALDRCDQEQGTAAVHDAHRMGVNYFDVAPAYGDAEIKLGIALEGIDRASYFLACKTTKRDRQGAREELERSLQRLKTDHFDLYQMHCLQRPEEVTRALGPGGAKETFLEAQAEGKVKALGFSAHTTKAALAAMENFRFDTVMFPVSFVEYFTLGFGKPVLKLAAEQGAAVLAIKGMCRGAWPQDMKRTRANWYRPVEDDAEVSMALRFTLSQEPVASAIAPGFVDLAEKVIRAAATYQPITEEETEKLRALAQTCPSLFRREEERVASALPERHRRGPCYPESPHECGSEEVA